MGKEEQVQGREKKMETERPPGERHPSSKSRIEIKYRMRRREERITETTNTTRIGFGVLRAKG
jgi:hypothetical protein